MMESVFAKYFYEKIVTKWLLATLIIYQKLPYSILSDLYGIIKYWDLLVMHQKLGQTTMCHMLKYKHDNSLHEESIRFNKLMIKHQLIKEQQALFIMT